jgi:putative hydrolase of the HAD superfamily
MATRVGVILFDLDNTLLLEDESTTRALERTWAAIAPQVGAAPAALAAAARAAAEELFRGSPVYTYADAMGIWWGEALWGDFAGESEGLRAMRAFVPGFRQRVWERATGASGTAEPTLIEAAIEAFRSARLATQLVDPDAETVVVDLARDHRLVLVTNGAPDVQRAKLARTSLAPHFAATVISAEIEIGKPDPRIFERALAAVGAEADEAVMVGDSLARDVAGAQAAGVRAIWFDRGAARVEPVAPVPDARITSLREVRPALSALAPAGASPRGSPGPRPAGARDASPGRASRTGDPSAR